MCEREKYRLVRVCACSCNGIPKCSDLLPDMASDEALYRMWDDMWRRHDQGPNVPAKYHLLHMGGDQVYSGAVWRSFSFLFLSLLPLRPTRRDCLPFHAPADPLWTAVAAVRQWVDSISKETFHINTEQSFTNDMKQVPLFALISSGK